MDLTEKPVKQEYKFKGKSFKGMPPISTLYNDLIQILVEFEKYMI